MKHLQSFIYGDPSIRVCNVCIKKEQETELLRDTIQKTL